MLKKPNYENVLNKKIPLVIILHKINSPIRNTYSFVKFYHLIILNNRK